VQKGWGFWSQQGIEREVCASIELLDEHIFVLQFTAEQQELGVFVQEGAGDPTARSFVVDTHPLKRRRLTPKRCGDLALRREAYAAVIALCTSAIALLFGSLDRPSSGAEATWVRRDTSC
jgi:hypothetical protein